MPAEITAYKVIFSSLGILLTLMAFIPYIRSILRGSTQPHVFSWIIWGSTTFIVFLAQMEGGGGIGAWPIGVSGGITLLIAALAYIRRGDVSITKTDWLFFCIAISALPLWSYTSDPLWAVVLLTIIDLLGFGPTIRKLFHAPESESLIFFTLFMIRNVLVITALQTYSITTVLFPAATGTACLLLIGLATLRKHQLQTRR